MQPGRMFHETPITRAGARGESVEADTHLVDVGPQVERRAVGEERSPLRVDPDQLKIVVQAPASFGENAGQHRRQSQNGRPHVEAEAIHFEDCRLAPEPVASSRRGQHSNRARQRTRRRQPAQASANDADSAGSGGRRSFLLLHLTSQTGHLIRLATKRRCRRVRLGQCSGKLADRHKSSSSSREVIRADSKITGKPLPG